MQHIYRVSFHHRPSGLSALFWWLRPPFPVPIDATIHPRPSTSQSQQHYSMNIPMRHKRGRTRWDDIITKQCPSNTLGIKLSHRVITPIIEGPYLTKWFVLFSTSTALVQIYIKCTHGVPDQKKTHNIIEGASAEFLNITALTGLLSPALPQQ